MRSFVIQSWQDPREEPWEEDIPEDRVPPEIRALVTPEIRAEEIRLEARWEAGRSEREAHWAEVAAQEAVKNAARVAAEAGRAAEAQENRLRRLYMEADRLAAELDDVREIIACLEGKKMSK